MCAAPAAYQSRPASRSAPVAMPTRSTPYQNIAAFFSSRSVIGAPAKLASSHASPRSIAGPASPSATPCCRATHSSVSPAQVMPPSAGVFFREVAGP